MQCFICVTYMIFIYSWTGDSRVVPGDIEKRSLFHDVIQSIRIRSQASGDFGRNDENNLSHYEDNGYDNEPPRLPTDTGFLPRRNDRLEMPPLRYRFPKNLPLNETENDDDNQEEVVVYINTTTQKPKKKIRPTTNRTKPEVVTDPYMTQNPTEYSWTNSMAGQSHIGNRESQMVVKPTVIVNIRGSVNHKDSEIRLQGRTTSNGTEDSVVNIPPTIFNINQEIKVQRTFGGAGSRGTKVPRPNFDVKVISGKEMSNIEEDMEMCETATWNPEKNREPRKFENVLKIMFSLSKK